MTKEDVFRPAWPQGLEVGKYYEIPCDDDGQSLDAKLKVLIAQDGDVHISTVKLQQFRSKGALLLDGLPSVRIRSRPGGGRNLRTRQALLWLAEAIRLDTKDNPPEESPAADDLPETYDVPEQFVTFFAHVRPVLRYTRRGEDNWVVHIWDGVWVLHGNVTDVVASSEYRKAVEVHTLQSREFTTASKATV